MSRTRPVLGAVVGAIAGLLVGAGSVVAWYQTAAPPAGPAAPAAAAPVQLESAPPAARAPLRGAPGLAAIAAMPDDFERNAALYALARDADRAAIEGLLAETHALAPSPQRNDIARVLYIRFASIDPVAAADHVLGRFYQPSWIATVFRVWAHADFDAAVERAASLEPRQRRPVAASLLEMDLAPWQRQHVAERLGARGLLAELLAREEMAFGTPEQTWARALASPPGDERAQLLEMAALAWAASDPEAALRAALEAEDDDSRYLASQLLRRWARRDRDGALAWLSRLERTPRTDFLPSTVVGSIAAEDIDAALRALEDVPPWARQNAQYGLLSQWMDADLPAALEWFGSLPLADQKHHGWSVARRYTERDPRGAFEWGLASDPRIRRDRLMQVIGSIADSAQAERLFRGIEDPELRAELAFSLHYNHAPQDPQAALRWAETFDEAIRDRLRSGILRQWAEADPDGAALEVNRQRTPSLRDETAADLISGLLAGFHVDAAERMFESIDTPRVRCSAAQTLSFYFTYTDAVPAKAALYRAIVRSCRPG